MTDPKLAARQLQLQHEAVCTVLEAILNEITSGADSNKVMRLKNAVGAYASHNGMKWTVRREPISPPSRPG